MGVLGLCFFACVCVCVQLFELIINTITMGSQFCALLQPVAIHVKIVKVQIQNIQIENIKTGKCRMEWPILVTVLRGAVWLHHSHQLIKWLLSWLLESRQFPNQFVCCKTAIILQKRCFCFITKYLVITVVGVSSLCKFNECVQCWKSWDWSWYLNKFY